MPTLPPPEDAPEELDGYKRTFLVPVDMRDFSIAFGVAKGDLMSPQIYYTCAMKQFLSIVEGRAQLYWGYYLAEPERTLFLLKPGQDCLWPGAIPDPVWVQRIADFRASVPSVPVCKECACDGRVQLPGFDVAYDRASGRFFIDCKTCHIPLEG